MDEYTIVSSCHTSQLAYLMDRMKNIDDGNGANMLENSVVFYGCGMKDGNGHNKSDLPLLLAGHGGGKLKPGTHLASPKKTPLPNLHLTLLDVFGINTPTINGVGTGKINGLLV